MKTVVLQRFANQPKVVTVIKRWELNAKTRSDHAAKILGQKSRILGMSFPQFKNEQDAYKAKQNNYDFIDLQLDAQKFLGHLTGNPVAVATIRATQEVKAAAKKTGKVLTAAEVELTKKTIGSAQAKEVGKTIDEKIVKPVTGFLGGIFDSLKWIIIAVVIIGAIMLLSKTKAVLS